MLHRHVDLEAYELALEDDPARARALADRAATCRTCSTALAEGPLSARLRDWPLPAAASAPADWEAALRSAIAPARQPAAPGGRGLRRILLVPALLALLLAVLLPASASASVDSPLFPLRGIQEDARWTFTPADQRAQLESELASTYLWDARVQVGHGDSAGYRSDMDRFFLWAHRLKADTPLAPKPGRAEVHANVVAAQAVLASFAGTSADQSDLQQAGEVLTNVQGQSQEGDGEHPGNG